MHESTRDRRGIAGILQELRYRRRLDRYLLPVANHTIGHRVLPGKKRTAGGNAGCACRVGAREMDAPLPYAVNGRCLQYRMVFQ